MRNKALIRRFIEEVHNKGNFALFNELFAPNYVNHSAPANQNDRAAREQGIRSYRAAAPDLRVTIDDMIAEEWIVWDTLSWAQQLGFQMRR